VCWDFLVAIGFDAEAATALGIGYAPRGMMSGLVAVPIRLEDGSLAEYIGITEAGCLNRFTCLRATWCVSRRASE
jgi:hypothetical protein